MSLKARVESESQAAKRITIADLVCRDCIHRLDDTEIPGNTSFCKVYTRPTGKPDKVLLGEHCTSYKKEEN